MLPVSGIVVAVNHLVYCGDLFVFQSSSRQEEKLGSEIRLVSCNDGCVITAHFCSQKEILVKKMRGN